MGYEKQPIFEPCLPKFSIFLKNTSHYLQLKSFSSEPCYDCYVPSAEALRSHGIAKLYSQNSVFPGIFKTCTTFSHPKSPSREPCYIPSPKALRSHGTAKLSSPLSSFALLPQANTEEEGFLGGCSLLKLMRKCDGLMLTRIRGFQTMENGNKHFFQVWLIILTKN